MATLTETRHTAGFISSESNGNRSRKVITLLAAETTGGLAAGTVVGAMNAADGTWGKYDNTDPDSADGVLIEAVDASSANVSATIICRDAEVNQDELTVGGDATSIAAAKVDLEGLGIIYR